MRIVIFTRSELPPGNDAFFRRLAAEPSVELAAIVIDDFPWRTRSLAQRIKRHGLGYLGFKLRQKAVEKLAGPFRARWHRDHPLHDERPTWTGLKQLGIPIHRVPDIHAPPALDLIRSLQADLGLICGGRILADKVISIPPLGTLNIHKRKTPEYRGGGRIGYWEVLAREPAIAVTIHYAVPEVDAGAVLAQRIIPIETFDTLDSLGIKANIVGSDLYAEVVISLARGQGPTPIPQDPKQGKTYRGAGDLPEVRLNQELHTRRERKVERLGLSRDYYRSPMLWIKYACAYPRLMRRRRELEALGQAPIIGIFYHRVANDALTSGTMPLEWFVGQMEFIRAHFPIISLDDAHRRLAAGYNEETAFVITFDDGYASLCNHALPYLRQQRIPATLYVSVGHVLEGRPFEHDVRRGVGAAHPMTLEEMCEAECDGISIGSHAWFHENCAMTTGVELQRAIIGSRDRLHELLGTAPTSFAFPKGQRGVHISRESWDLAAEHYPIVCSAFGGINFPKDGGQHIKRIAHPELPGAMAMLMDGFQGLGDVLRGDPWAWRRSEVQPY